MPSFSQNVSVDLSDYVDVDVDINVGDYLDECDSTELTEIINYLVKEKLVTKQSPVGDVSVPEQLFEEALNKIHGKWSRLTAEEEQMIYRISNKF